MWTFIPRLPIGSTSRWHTYARIPSPDEATLKKARRSSGFGSTQLVKCAIPRQVRSYLHYVIQEQREDGLWMLRPNGTPSVNERLSGAVKGMVDEVLAQIAACARGNVHLFDYPPMEFCERACKHWRSP